MKRILRLLNRFGMGRAIALVLLVDLVLLRIWDPLPVEALRLRTFDLYQLIAPRVATAAAGRHRRHRRGQPQERSANGRGRARIVADLVTRVTQMGAAAIGFDVVFAEPDRSSPALAADSFRGLDEETRAQAQGAAVERRRARRGDRPLARHPRPDGLRSRRKPRTPPAGRTAVAGWARRPIAEAAPRRLSRPPAQRARARAWQRRAAASSPSVPSATASCAACRSSCGPRRRSCRRLTLEMLRVVTRRRRHPDQDRRGRHSGRRLARLRDPDRRQRAALGAFLPARQDPLRLGEGRARRPRPTPSASQRSSSSSAPPRSGSSTSRRRRSIRRCRASRSTPSCSKACSARRC